MESLAAKFHRFHDKARPVIGTCLYGLAASLAAVAFQLAINWLYGLCFKTAASETGAHVRAHLLATSFAAIVISSLIVGWLLRGFCPEAAGSGIPQVKLNFWKNFGFAPRRIALVKFIAGIISIGGGQSLGREGPTVQIGSNLASTLAGVLGVSKQNRRAASAAGAAAGLAAAFNAPLASVAFVLEEIIGDLNSRALGSVLLASVIGAFVVHACIGPQPAFALPRIEEPTWRAYLLMPFAAALAALAGIAFQRGCLALRARTRDSFLPGWLQPLLGGITTWVIGAVVFLWCGRLGIFALGYDDLSDALAHGIAWKIAAVLLVGKLIATIACYGLGGCGGIFSPNLFFGGMCGAAVASLATQFIRVNTSDAIFLVVGGMSACLGAVVQAPVTAILIIFEMTHQFALVPGLMLAGLVSQGIARAFGGVNFYEAVLHQDGHQMEHLVPPRDLRSWQNLPLSAIAHFQPVLVEETSPDALRQLLSRHPYRCFPVVENERLTGFVTRAEIERALIEQRAPRIEPPVTCAPGMPIREAQNFLLESTVGAIAIAADPRGKVLAVVTLHDLLRAQVAMSEREAINA